MPAERSAGIILFRETAGGRRYLILRASRDESAIAPGKKVKEFWDFPKGRLEPGESGIEAAKREAIEEAGIKNFELVPEFKETIQYFTRRDGKFIPKFVALFLAKSKTDQIKLSWEHDRYEWLLYGEALERITLKEMKRALEAAEKFLNR